jgi:hypothetical protein
VGTVTGDAEAVDEDIGVSAAQLIELVSAQFEEGLRPGEVTIRMFIDLMRERKGKELRYSQAAYRLNRLVEMGLMRSRLVLYDGTQRLAFSWVRNGNDGRGQSDDDE